VAPNHGQNLVAARANFCQPGSRAYFRHAARLSGTSTVDSEGRILVPKHLRDSLGMQPGTTVDVTAYGAGLQVLPAGRTARIVQIDGKTVAESDTLVTDDVVFGLIDSLRR